MAILIAGFALVEPLTHAWLLFIPPAGAVSTGLHIQDDCLFLTSMRMGPSGFFSPYASCRAEAGPYSPQWFRVPYYWMYAAVGLPTAIPGVNDFLWLGAVNGMGLGVCLWAAWAFLKQAAPNLAFRAFVLFTVGGGVGGLAYIAAAVLGLREAAGFEAVFRRFAVYELMEGAYLYPHLHANRLYYTLPVAMGLFSVTLALKELRGGGAFHRRAWPRWVAAMLLLYTGTFINQRLGPLLWAVGFFLAVTGTRSPKRSAVTLALMGLPVLLASVHSWVFMAERFKEATAAYTAGSIWVSAFATAALLHLPLLVLVTVAWGRQFRGLAGLIFWPTVGYLGVFLTLYGGYQVYYGNILVMRDVAVAVWASDKALAGAAAGAVVGVWRWRGQAPQRGGPAHGWALLWFLTFFAAGVSAFLNGRYLVLGPMKLLVLLGLPMSVVAAAGLTEIEARAPRLARAWHGAIVALGLVSIAVATLHFQGPLGRSPGEGPFRQHHYDLMTPADAKVLAAVPAGFLLSPYGTPLFGDVAAERYGLRPVFGNGSALMGDHTLPAFREEVERFYDPAATDAQRRAFVEKWCVDYVHCPDTDPVPAATRAAFAEASWLRPMKSAGRAALFKVVQP